MFIHGQIIVRRNGTNFCFLPIILGRNWNKNGQCCQIVAVFLQHSLLVFFLFTPLHFSIPGCSRNRSPTCYIPNNDIKVGSNVEVDGAPWRVIEFLHVKPGKGAAYVRTTMRNYVTGNTVEKTFRAGSKTTYEEYRLNASDVGDKEKWLKEGMDCNLLFWKDKVIDFDLPINVKLKVVEVDPGLRGDTAQGGSKPATLETGAVVNVPLFVEKGQEIVVDTRSGQYMSRG